MADYMLVILRGLSRFLFVLRLGKCHTLFAALLRLWCLFSLNFKQRKKGAGYLIVIGDATGVVVKISYCV